MASRTVIISGASSGIGADTARLFASHGDNLMLHGNKSKDALYALADELREKHGIDVLTYICDIADYDEVHNMVNMCADHFGAVDVLVNNAGMAQQKLFTDITPDEFKRMLDVNVCGVYNASHAVLPHMIHRKRGAIVNISSVWGVYGASTEVHYSASKAAVIGLTKALAQEVGPSGITVNCIAPGVIDTRMNASFDNDTIDSLIYDTPLCRLGTGADIAAAVYFLSSSEASFITGQVLGVDGGFR